MIDLEASPYSPPQADLTKHDHLFSKLRKIGIVWGFVFAFPVFAFATYGFYSELINSGNKPPDFWLGIVVALSLFTSGGFIVYSAFQIQQLADSNTANKILHVTKSSFYISISFIIPPTLLQIVKTNPNINTIDITTIIIFGKILFYFSVMILVVSIYVSILSLIVFWHQKKTRTRIRSTNA